MIASSIPDAAFIPADPPADPSADELLELDQVEAARSGCEVAFRQLMERHQQRIHRLCYHYLGNHEDALEACQDTFVRAHRALPRFVPRARLSTWLHRIALNLCHDHLRRRRPTLPLEGVDPVCVRAAPDEAAAHTADLERLSTALASLPARLQKLLVLSCLEGLSHTECAAILKCTERAVEGRLYRARQRLSKAWEGQAAQAW